MATFSLEQFLFRAIRIGIILALFAPLALGPFGLSFSEYPKALYFRVVIDIAFILWMLLLWKYPRYLPKLNLLSASVLLFFAVLSISAAFGFNPSRSFWGSTEIGGGLATYLHYLAFFLLLISVFRDKEDWLFLLRWALGVAFLSTLAGFLQQLGVAGFYGVGVGAGRISGTLSNPVYFGAYMVMAIFLGIYLIAKESRRDWKIALGVVTVLNLLALVISGTRGAFVGFGVGLAVFLAFMFFFVWSKNWRIRKLALGLALAGSTAMLLFVLLEPSVESDGMLTGFSRIKTIFDPSAIEGRFPGWETAVRAWQDRPFFGWGPESFSYLYDKYFDHHYLNHIVGYIVFFDAHNTILNYLAENGLAGAVTYLLIFGLILYALWQGRHQEGFLPTFALIGLFAGYFVQNLFAFDTVSTYVLFYLLVAFVAVNFSLPLFRFPRLSLSAKGGDILRGAAAICGISAALFFMYFLNLKPALASYEFVRGFYGEEKDFIGSLNSYQRAIDRDTPYTREFVFIMVSRDLSALAKGPDQKSFKAIMQNLDRFTPYMEIQLDRPEIRYLNFQELLANVWIWRHLVRKEEGALEKAQQFAEKGLAFNPEWKSFYYILGRVEIYRGNYDKAEAYFDQGFRYSRQDLWDMFSRYKDSGDAYIKAGDKQNGAASLLKAVNAWYVGAKNNLLGPAGVLITPEEARKQTQDQVPVFELAAWLYWQQGDKEIALDIYRKALEVFPEWEVRLKTNLKKMQTQQ